MDLSHYTNMAGQRFPLTERSLEPPDCWRSDESTEVLPDTKANQDRFVLEDASHFVDFIRTAFPEAIDLYLSQNLTLYNEFLGVS